MSQRDLIPMNKRSEDEAKEMGRKGGINSGKARLRKKHGRELVRALLDMREPDKRVLQELADTFGLTEKDVTKEVAMHARQIDKAIRKADTNAFNAVNKASGLIEDAEAPQTVQIVIGQEVVKAAQKWGAKK